MEGKIFMGLLFSLLLSSSLISIIYMDREGKKIEGIDIPEFTSKFFSEQDFTSSLTYNRTLIREIDGTVNITEGIGIVLKHNQGVLFKNIKKDVNGDITVKYYINNSVHADFLLFVRESAVQLDNIALLVDKDGIYIVNNVVYNLGVFIKEKGFSYPDLNLIDSLEITTVFNEEYKTLAIIVNGNTLGILTDLTDRSIFSLVVDSAGIENKGNDQLTINLIDSNFSSSHESNWFTQLSDFLSIMGRVIAWTLPEEYLPLWLNLLLIKSQLVTLVALLIFNIIGG